VKHSITEFVITTAPAVATRRAEPDDAPAGETAVRAKSPAVAIARFVSTLFAARDQAHVFHLQTASYARHKALQKFYGAVVDLADAYVEIAQARYGMIAGYAPPAAWQEGESQILPWIDQLVAHVAEMEPALPDDCDLENAYADVLALCHRTQYLLHRLT